MGQAPGVGVATRGGTRPFTKAPPKVIHVAQTRMQLGSSNKDPAARHADVRTILIREQARRLRLYSWSVCPSSRSICSMLGKLVSSSFGSASTS